jgi:hypothetical protein
LHPNAQVVPATAFAVKKINVRQPPVPHHARPIKYTITCWVLSSRR